MFSVWSLKWRHPRTSTGDSWALHLTVSLLHFLPVSTLSLKNATSHVKHLSSQLEWFTSSGLWQALDSSALNYSCWYIYSAICFQIPWKETSDPRHHWLSTWYSAFHCKHLTYMFINEPWCQSHLALQLFHVCELVLPKTACVSYGNPCPSLGYS